MATAELPPDCQHFGPNSPSARASALSPIWPVFPSDLFEPLFVATKQKRKQGNSSIRFDGNWCEPLHFSFSNIKKIKRLDENYIADLQVFLALWRWTNGSDKKERQPGTCYWSGGGNSVLPGVLAGCSDYDRDHVLIAAFPMLRKIAGPTTPFDCNMVPLRKTAKEQRVEKKPLTNDELKEELERELQEPEHELRFEDAKWEQTWDDYDQQFDDETWCEYEDRLECKEASHLWQVRKEHDRWIKYCEDVADLDWRKKPDLYGDRMGEVILAFLHDSKENGARTDDGLEVWRTNFPEKLRNRFVGRAKDYPRKLRRYLTTIEGPRGYPYYLTKRGKTVRRNVSFIRPELDELGKVARRGLSRYEKSFFLIRRKDENEKSVKLPQENSNEPLSEIHHGKLCARRRGERKYCRYWEPDEDAAWKEYGGAEAFIERWFLTESIERREGKRELVITPIRRFRSADKPGDKDILLKKSQQLSDGAIADELKLPGHDYVNKRLRYHMNEMEEYFRDDRLDLLKEKSQIGVWGDDSTFRRFRQLEMDDTEANGKEQAEIEYEFDMLDYGYKVCRKIKPSNLRLAVISEIDNS